jgi:ATP-dependent Clp protease adaptor protein ClpS
MLNNSGSATPEELELLDTKIQDGITFPYKVILFNDEIHTFDEVITQILKAINCTYDRAEELTWEIHTKGKACVFEGDMPECLKVSAVLEEIGLITQVEV